MHKLMFGQRGSWREMGLWGVHFCNVKARAAIRKAGVVFCTLDYLLLEARPLLHWYDCYCLWVFALVWLLRTERELNHVETSAAPLLHDQPFSDPFKKLSCRSDVALLHTKTQMIKLQYNREATLKCCTTNIAGSFIGATATGMCNHVETFAAPILRLSLYHSSLNLIWPKFWHSFDQCLPENTVLPNPSYLQRDCKLVSEAEWCVVFSDVGFWGKNWISFSIVGTATKQLEADVRHLKVCKNCECCPCHSLFKGHYECWDCCSKCNCCS